jgi:prepilin-type N-terminal cleavage/methylation domain-containing protein
MTSIRDRLTHRLRRARGGVDEGFTMIEIMVSMSLMTFFMAMFTGAVLQMYKVSNKTQAVTNSSTQLNIAFERIDKQVRYASAISPPNQTKSVLGGWYVEFVNTTSGTDTCYQLRVYNSQLQERTWSGTPTAPPTWFSLANGVVMPTSSPFSFNTAAGSQTAQRLTLSLATTASARDTVTTSQTKVTFEAMNSGQGTSPTNDGSSLICQNTGDGGRP